MMIVINMMIGAIYFLSGTMAMRLGRPRKPQ